MKPPPCSNALQATRSLRLFFAWPPMPTLSFQRCPLAALANRPPISQVAAHSNGRATRNARWPPQASSENFAVSIITKNRFQSVVSVHHVIQRPFIFHSRFPRHLNKTHSNLHNVKGGELTPFPGQFIRVSTMVLKEGLKCLSANCSGGTDANLCHSFTLARESQMPFG